MWRKLSLLVLLLLVIVQFDININNFDLKYTIRKFEKVWRLHGINNYFRFRSSIQQQKKNEEVALILFVFS